MNRDELHDMYVIQHLTDRQIASQLGVTVSKVRRWRQAFGISTIGKTDRHQVEPIENRLLAILIGSMLGDGRLSRSNGVTRYMECHSEAQKPYIEWKVQEWGYWVKAGLRPVMWREFPGWRFETVSHVSLTKWHSFFYPVKGPKCLWHVNPMLVTDLSLAVWFMDDGSAGWWPRITFGMDLRSRGVALNVLNKMGFSPRWELHKGKTGDFIFEGEEQAERFISLVKPHMPEFMRYKLKFGFQGPQYQLRKKLTPEVLSALAAQGVPIRRMAEQLGEAPTTIDRFLKRYGIDHPRTIGRPSG